jgi:hypothetical protein
MPITNKFFVYPFANVGDVATIPDTIQPSGAVSYPQGFTVKYELDPTIDPTALEVPRLETNQVLLDATNALKQYQISGVPNFITTSDNLGSPWSYDKYAKALYDDGINGLRPYVSLVDLNTSLPTDQTKWVVDTLNPQTLRSGEFIVYTSTGIPNSLQVTPNDSYLSTLTIGTQIKIIANSTNTNATTLNIGNGSGPIAINIVGPTGLIPLSGGEIINTGIYDFIFNGSVWVLTNPTNSGNFYGASVWSSVSQSIGAGPTKINYDTPIYDTNGIFDPINHRFIVGKIGYFSFNANIGFSGVGSGIGTVFLYKNGSPIAETSAIANTGDTVPPNYVEDFASSASDYYEIFCGFSGAGKNTLASIVFKFQMKYLGK